MLFVSEWDLMPTLAFFCSRFEHTRLAYEALMGPQRYTAYYDLKRGGWFVSVEGER